MPRDNGLCNLLFIVLLLLTVLVRVLLQESILASMKFQNMKVLQDAQ
jgi:hypothetical protein